MRDYRARPTPKRIDANQGVLGLSSVAEVGGGLEFLLWPKEEDSKRVRLGGEYLIGPNVTGWTIILGLRHSL